MQEENIQNEQKGLTPDDVIAHGIDCHIEKKYFSKEMRASAKLCEEETGTSKKSMLKTKDYIFYKGNGWGKNSIEKSEEKEKYPDRIAPVFRKLLDVVSNLYTTGKKELLDDYLDDLAAYGIIITVDETMFVEPDADTKDVIDRYLQAMCNYQKSICEQDEYMSDTLAIQAESVDLSPKNKYKQIIQLAAKKLEGKDINDKVQDEYEKTGLYINGLAKVSQMDMVMPDPLII